MPSPSKHVLVTGAARRLGRAIAVHFLSEGYRVTAHYHRSEAEMSSLQDFADKSKYLNPVCADLEKDGEAKSLYLKASKAFGPVDILINSAAVFFQTPAASLTEKAWDGIININLRASYFLAQSCAEGGMGMRDGLIVNIADIFGLRPLNRFSFYSISKAGVLMATKALAREWAPKIRVNAISPGVVLLPDNYKEKQRERAIQNTLLHRLGNPDDILAAIRFFLENHYVTGMNLVVDGGQSLLLAH